MTERDELLASIAGTIKDYRAGEIPERTPARVARWIDQFSDDVQVPMLRELDYVFKRTYVSRNRAREVLAEIANRFPCKFWQDAHILDIQQDGRSQSEIRDLFLPILQARCGSDIDYQGSSGGIFVYLDDAIFSGNRVIQDLSYWTQTDTPYNATLHVITIAIHKGGRYWIEKRHGNPGSKPYCRFPMVNQFTFENRRACRDQSDVLWPTADVFESEGFFPRNPILPFVSRIFSSEKGRQLLENEFLKAGRQIINRHTQISPSLKPLGFSNFEPGFGSLLVFYRNCANNCPLALWWDVGGWHPLFPRKTYQRQGSSHDAHLNQ